MRRKSERNKAKGSPEKKVEKPTRKSTRRRGKRATSSSPERDDSQEDTTSDASLSREGNKELARLQTKDLMKSIPEESKSVILTQEVVEKDSSPETEDNGSVWKVARADASPGEIQKLKLCRQRNISETSDNSTSRKRSHKWQGSGEGVAEEADSNDERLSSPKVELSGKQSDDVSSLPPGQDSNQEVSDYKETLPETTSANLSDDKPNIDQQGDSNEASCSNLSNDIKPEPIDTQADHIPYEDDAAQAVSRLQEIMTEQIGGAYGQDSQQQIMLDAEEQDPERVEMVEAIPEQDDGIPKQEESCDKEYDAPAIVEHSPQQEKEISEIKKEVVPQDETTEVGNQVHPEEISKVDDPVPSEEIPPLEEQVSPEAIPEVKKHISTLKQKSLQEGEILQKEEMKQEEEVKEGEEETLEKEGNTPQRGGESPEEEEATSVKDDPKSSSSEDEREKVHSDSNSVDESQIKKIRSSVKASSRSNRRKHRTKYRDSSNSDTPESEDEENFQEREPKQSETPEEDEEDKVPTEKKSSRNKSRSKSPEPSETYSLSNSGKRVDRVKNEEKKDDDSTSVEESKTTLSDAATIPKLKPAKINLKRTFSTRISVEEPKVEDSSLSANIDSTQTKENNANDSSEQKRVPKRRRWGTTTASADSNIEFSISTDSLKALVPGAKPLSITEVRLSKDDEDEQVRDKGRDKQTTSDSNGEYTVRENTVTPKSEGPRKHDTKADNHIGSRRKISVVRDIPQATSPSPPSAQATSILLIKNLVRPFTLTQIKELLSRTGSIVENGFWMDRIKSKCYVEYSNEDQAFETRQALHGISWPLSNPKKLQVEYASKEDMELARESSEDQPISRKEEPHLADSWQRDWSRDDKNQVGGTKVVVVREWDLGKEDGQQHLVKEEREKKDLQKIKRQRSQSPLAEVHLPAPARKFKKKEDEPPPAKLLDDLFRKTKALPCIYWLPLTNEQIVVKEEMRRQHMAEHARRLEEMRRAERNRDSRRRRSPRK